MRTRDRQGPGRASDGVRREVHDVPNVSEGALSLRHKSRRVLRFGVCSVIVLTTFWATHEWERRATLREYRWASGVTAEPAAAEQVSEGLGLQAEEPDAEPAPVSIGDTADEAIGPALP